MGFEWVKSDKLAVHNKLLMYANVYEDKKQTGLKNIVYKPDGRAVWVGEKYHYAVICKKVEGNRTILFG